MRRKRINNKKLDNGETTLKRKIIERKKDENKEKKIERKKMKGKYTLIAKHFN